MKKINYWCLLFFFSCTTLVWASDPPSTNGDRKTYIVYLGEKLSGLLPAATIHTTMLSAILGSDASKSILHNYKNFNGFVVKLTEEERKKIAAMKGIVSIFPSTKKQLHTTRSWDFMGFTQQVNRSTLESDIIVGVLDSGIWPESESFSDVGFGPPPLKWKGTCDTSLNFTCNNKLIGAKYYKSDLQFGPTDIQSPRDDDGHGTHTASTAAGGYVNSASLFGLGLGTARGGVPTARIAAYKVCWNSGGCEDADILAAFDDAIADGVDIISLSLGEPEAKDYFQDAIAIGTFHAMKNGILTVASAGNNGPEYETISNVAPWLMSVAASTIDRAFHTSVQLGNSLSYNGVSINTFDLNGTMYPLIHGGDAPNTAAGFSSVDSSFCVDNSLNPSLVSGKIVLCDSPTTGQSAIAAGAVGAISQSGAPTDSARSAAVAYSSLGEIDGEAIFSYMLLSSNPTATIFKSIEVNQSLGPYVATFSSRGPNPVTLDILKPDITAPGSNILAAWSPIAPLSGVVEDKREVQFNIISGTSMSCPHVSGIAAYIKSYYPNWSPAAIRSAMMTTATPMDTNNTSLGLEFAYGAGHLNPLRVLSPGLVYDADVNDYINFLCGQGYDGALLQRITGDTSTCTSPISARDLNYPSFSLSVTGYVPFSATLSRKVTNVGPGASTYQVKINAYIGLNVQVVPQTLSFSSKGETLSYEVTIQGTIESLTMISNSLVWDDGVHTVRSPIVVFSVV